MNRNISKSQYNWVKQDNIVVHDSILDFEHAASAIHCYHWPHSPDATHTSSVASWLCAPAALAGASHSLLLPSTLSRFSLCTLCQIGSDSQDADKLRRPLHLPVVVFVVVVCYVTMSSSQCLTYLSLPKQRCTRDAFAKAHRYAHAHVPALSLNPDRDFYHYWQRNPFLSLGPGVEASIPRRRRLRAPDPHFPTRAFSWRIRGCDPAVAMPHANSVVSVNPLALSPL